MILQNIDETKQFIEAQTNGFLPVWGIILGTGLGKLADEIDVSYELSYQDIPHFAHSTVESHAGKLIFGHLSGQKVLCMQGRFHYYEGYSMQQITFPVRVMKALGVAKLLVSNASGGLNPDFEVAQLMLIEDHISLFLPDNPLLGKHISGERFPDMSEPYSISLIEKTQKIAQKQGILLQKGVYVAVTGPQLETRAEYRILRMLGADAVGMSTVPEVMVARQLDMEVLGLSVITDLCQPDRLDKVALEHILVAAHKAEPHLVQLVKEVLKQG